MNNQVDFRPFSCHTPALETALDVLTGIAATGDLVVSANLIDDQTRTPLPPEAFDGEPIIPYIQQLEADSKVVLKKPVYLSAIHNRMLTDVSSRLQKTYLDRIDRLGFAISQVEALIQQAEQTVYREIYYARLERQMMQYRQQLEQAQAGLCRLQSMVGR